MEFTEKEMGVLRYIASEYSGSLIKFYDQGLAESTPTMLDTVYKMHLQIEAYIAGTILLEELNKDILAGFIQMLRVWPHLNLQEDVESLSHKLSQVLMNPINLN